GGDPEIRHVSLVRTTQDGPATVNSRIGLYIPRDGGQEIALEQTAPESLSYIAPFSMHPHHVTDQIAFTAVLDYAVPVRHVTNKEAPELVVPFRSTLKKLETQWVGDAGSISGQPKLLAGAYQVGGSLTNHTGVDLKDVYFAFIDA